MAINKDYLESYIGEKYKYNKMDFSRSFGSQNQRTAYNRVEALLGKGGKNVASDFIELLIEYHPDFDIFKFLGFENKKMHSVQNDLGSMIVVPAGAGYLELINNPQKLDAMDKMFIPLKNSTNAEKRVFQVAGDSMSPTVIDEDLLVAEKVPNILDIKDNDIYIIVTRRSGVMFKRIGLISKDEQYIYVKSDNVDHEPFRVFFDDIIEVWRARAKITYNLREHRKFQDKLNYLENMILDLKNNMK